MDVLSIRGVIRRNLLVIFLITLIGGVGGFYAILRAQALREAQARTAILLSSAIGVRDYTETHILPLLSTLPDQSFHEESVPFYAAQTVFKTVTAGDAAYSYREAALNPTSPADRADGFDVELIRRFADDPSLKELSGFRSDGAEQLYYSARPIRIEDSACLACHDTPARAPAAMVARYGNSNGFGWTLHQTVGVQVLSVPVTEQFRGMLQLVLILGASLLAVFAIAYAALSMSLDTLLVRPLRQLADAAESASRGDAASLLNNGPPASGVSELRRLSDAIGRLRTSLRKALDGLKLPSGPPDP